MTEEQFAAVMAKLDEHSAQLTDQGALMRAQSVQVRELRGDVDKLDRLVRQYTMAPPRGEPRLR